MAWPPAAARGALILVHLAAFGTGGPGSRGLSLVLQAVLGLVPVLFFGAAWSVLGCFFLGSVLLVAKPLVSVPLLVAVPGGLGVLVAGVGTPEVSVANGLHATAFTAAAAVALFGLSWATLLAAEREASRRALTARVVAEERKRFAQDTHDLLGLSLSAITLKVELVRRLVETRPEQAQHELTELVTMSREALADVRSVAAGKRDLCLLEEFRAAVALLETAGAKVRLAQKLTEHLPEPIATTFATVLRESATNVVRHSKATWCEFSIGVAGAKRGYGWRTTASRTTVPCRGEPAAATAMRCGTAEPGRACGLVGGELWPGRSPAAGTCCARPSAGAVGTSRIDPVLAPLKAIRRRWRSGSRAPGCER